MADSIITVGTSADAPKENAAPVVAALGVPASDKAPEAPAQATAPAPVEAPEQDHTEADADAAVRAVISQAKKPAQLAPNAMQSSMAQAVNTNPDMEAEARRVALRTGVPVQTVFAHPDEMKKRDALGQIDFDNFNKLYPTTAAVLSDPEVAKISHDDIDNMGEHESVLRSLGEGYALSSARMYLGAKAQFGDYTGNPDMAKEAIDDIKFSQNLEQDTAPKFESTAARLAYGATQGLVDSAPALLTAILNPLAGVGAFTAQAETSAYGKYRARGATIGEASLGGTAEGVVAAVTSFLPVKYLSDSLGKVGAGAFLTGFLARDLPSMEAQTVANGLINQSIANPNTSWADYAKTLPSEMAQAAVSALFTTGALGAVHGGVNYVKAAPARAEAAIAAENLAKARTAENDAQQFEKMNVLASESKLKARDPLAFQNFIDKVSQSDGAIENVYVNPRDLAQSGINLEELAAVSPTIADQVRVTLETGGDMQIPVSEYASHLAGTELGQAMVDHLKTSPLGMSRAESREFMQGHAEELQAAVEKAVGEQSTDDAFTQSANAVHEQVVGKLKEANRFTDDVNKQYATLISNFYKVQAARLGTTPEALFKEHPLDIKATMDEGSTLDQGAHDGDKFFKPEAIEKVRAQNEKSRDRLIYMHPQNFLDIAMSGQDKTKTERVGKLVKENTQFDEIPFLGFKHDGEGTAEVTSHEGRHRARALLAAGVTEMPVMLSHRADQNGQAMRWGELSKENFQDSWPKKLFAQVGDSTETKGNKGKSIAFPVADPRVLNQDKTTARGSFNPDTNVITLLKHADLSTFLHESGHFFLETMNKLALDPKAPDAIKADMQATLDWLGVKDLAEWNSHDLEWQREKHEQFARGFEAYLFEGKSPSIEMRGVFQRFRAWLLNVYRSLDALKVDLSPEVRGVFDRMLATGDQIRETELARSFEPMFKDAATAGMNEGEWRQYQELGIQATQDAQAILEARSMRDMKFMSNAKSRVLKDLQREAAGRRREVRDAVTSEVMDEPVNQARAFVTRGELELPPDANSATKRLATETGLGSTKMSLPALKEMYGEEANAPWRYFSTGKHGEVGTEGLHPDVIAELFGFSSGDEMVRAMLSAEKPAEKIEGMTDQRMLEKYGDLTDPVAMSQAADEAVHNEVRSRFVATELNALQKATGGRKILAEAAKRFAESMIDRLRVRDIQPSRYSAAEGRAARASEKALRKGDLNAAAVEKRNQLIQNYAARAAHEAVSEADKAVRYFNKFNRAGTRENISTDYLDQIDALLERFDLRKGQSLKAIDSRASLMKWKAAQEELGIEPEIPAELLDAAMRKSYKDMTLEEMRGLRDTIKQIEHLGRLKNKLLTAKDDRDFKTTVSQIVASIDAHAGNRLADNRSRPNAGDAAKRLFKGFVAQHRKVASLVRELDGFKDGGAMWETFGRTMNESGNKEATMRATATKKLAELVEPILDGKEMGGKGTFFPELGKSFNREERIGIALNMGNEGNIQRLLGGEGWTREQVQTVLDTITPQEAKFVQDVWDFFESYRPEIGAKEKRVYGKQPDWVEPSPINLGGQELRGGYYPIKYDPRQSIHAEQHADAEGAKAQMKGAYTSATTRRSFTKARVDEVKGRPLLYSMDGLYQGTNEIIHDLSWHEWLIDANRLLRNKALDGAIRTRYGADVTKQFKTAVQDIAGGEMPNQGALDNVLNHVRSGASVAALGLNIVNSVINLTGALQSIERIGPKWMAMGVSEWAANPAKLTKTVAEKSQMMANRAQTMQREINEVQSVVRGKSTARQIFDRMMYLPMQMTQVAVDTPTWWGAYQKGLTEGATDDKAVAMADQAVLDAQGGGQVKDLASIQRGGATQKLLTTFYGYFNTTFNLSVEAVKRTDFKDPNSVLKLGASYLMLYALPAALGTLIHTAVAGSDKDKKPKQLAKNLINDQISYMMSTMVGVRELTGAVQIGAGVNPYNEGYQGPAGLRVIQSIYDLATQIHQGKADDAAFKAASNVSGIIFHLPAAQINRTVLGTKALIQGKTHNPAAIVAGPPPKM